VGKQVGANKKVKKNEESLNPLGGSSRISDYETVVPGAQCINDPL